MKEMEALEKNVSWNLFQYLKERKTIGSRWVFTVKLKPDGCNDTYKVRPAAKGYIQRYGFSYPKTFAQYSRLLHSIQD